jgi:hypothetical protein
MRPASLLLLCLASVVCAVFLGAAPGATAQGTTGVGSAATTGAGLNNGANATTTGAPRPAATPAPKDDDDDDDKAEKERLEAENVAALFVISGILLVVFPLVALWSILSRNDATLKVLKQVQTRSFPLCVFFPFAMLSLLASPLLSVPPFSGTLLTIFQVEEDERTFEEQVALQDVRLAPMAQEPTGSERDGGRGDSKQEILEKHGLEALESDSGSDSSRNSNVSLESSSYEELTASARQRRVARQERGVSEKKVTLDG